MHNPPDSNEKFAIRYDKSEIAYISQFLVSPGNEEVLIDFSSGLLNDTSDPKTLPIQSRIALPWSAAERLATVLNQVIASKREQIKTRTKAPHSPPAPNVPQATLPQMTSS